MPVPREWPVADLTTADPANNPLQALFTDLGVPWKMSMKELVAAFGVSSHPVYDWPVIEFPLPALTLQGMLFPLYTNAFRVTGTAPTDYFSTAVSAGDDPRTNLEVASSLFAERLGDAPLSVDDGFSFRREWTSGPASLVLHAAGPHPWRSSTPSPSRQREPRLGSACSVNIYPGFRRALTDDERAQLSGARRILRISDDGAARDIEALRRTRPTTLTAQFAREPDDSCVPLLAAVHLSSDADALIVCREQLLLVPRERVASVRVRKLSRARGPAGSWLDLICADEASDDGFTSLTLLEGDRENQLDGQAAALGVRLDLPVEIWPAQPNA